MTADVADVVRAETPWANFKTACPLLDVRTASRRGYNASGQMFMSGPTFLLLCRNANPADLWGRRSTSPAWGASSLTELFVGDDLPVPCIDRNVPYGRVVLSQDGMPALTIDVGG